MISRTVGSRYAKALMAVTLEREENPEELLAELARTADALEATPRFLDVLSNPKAVIVERLRSLERLLDLLELRPLARHFLSMLLRKGRLGALPEIVEDLRTRADAQAGILRATVISAAPLTEGESGRLRSLLAARFGKSVELSLSVDPEIIGGVVVRIGSLSFDGSIRSQLHAIHSQLLKR